VHDGDVHNLGVVMVARASVEIQASVVNQAIVVNQDSIVSEDPLRGAG
jgi:hypothetical protein